MTDAQFPRYWTTETTRRLRPAIVAYLNGLPMTDEHSSTMRAYLRQWIEADGFVGPTVNDLRVMVGGLTTRPDIDDWLTLALEEGIDPL